MTFSDRHQLTNNVVEYEACIIGLETALDLGVRQLEIHRDSNLVIQHTQGIWRTRDKKLKPYHAYFDLLADRFDELRYIHLPIAKNQFADALATLASVIEIPAGVTMRPLLIETSSTIVVCGDALYRRSPDGMLLLCLDRTFANQVMREVHVGFRGSHMGGHMLARKIMRTGYFWLTMETDCCQFVEKCSERKMNGQLIHMPPSNLQALTSPLPFQYGVLILLGRYRPSLPMGMSTF